MGTIEVDLGNPDLFKPFKFKAMPKGKHLFEVENDLEVTPSGNPESENLVIKCVFVCQDEDENKGSKIWENFVLIVNPVTDGQIKAKKIHQANLCQFAVACGVLTQDEIESGAGIPLEEFKGKRFDAITKVENSKDEAGNDRQNTKIARYLFEPNAD